MSFMLIRYLREEHLLFVGKSPDVEEATKDHSNLQKK